MENSFFKFDTTLPPEDDGRGGGRNGNRRERTEEDAEEEYDALNDETFGSAINGDWENIHENLVRLDCMNGSTDSDKLNERNEHQNNNNNIDDDDDDDIVDDENSDLEINLSRVKLDDVDVGTDDNECRIQLDPSVWANPIKIDATNQQNNGTSSISNHQLYSSKPENFFRQTFTNPFDQLTHQIQQQQSQQTAAQHQQQAPQVSCFFGLPAPTPPPAIPTKICTVEDIERNIRLQQQQQQQQKTQLLQQHEQQSQQQKQQQQVQHHQQQQQQQQHKQLRPPTPKIKTSTPIQSSAPPQQSQQQAALGQIPPPLINGNFFNRPPMPPGFNPARPPNFGGVGGQHSLNIHHPLGPPPPQSQHRMPPGFPPMPPMMGGHQIPPPPPHHPNFPRNLAHNLPIALNNFAMHPNFNAMRPLIPPIPPPRLNSQPTMSNQQNSSNANVNQFNQRLMQEIQQNHPMLTNVRGPPNHNMYGQNNHHQQQQQQNIHQKQSGNSGGSGNKVNMRSNGNVPEEYDEYANLMSTRDKHWLIGIQLLQLNTDTPYIDDYYYTVYKDRKAKLYGDSQSKAHKDNQLNHPLTQPKGHAKLVLISMGNKNGTNNHHLHRNGQNNRERRNSVNTTTNTNTTSNNNNNNSNNNTNTNANKNDLNNKDQMMQQQSLSRTFTPLQFENSLGKLQYGSVTAPRKIIDMEIMGNDGGTQFNTTIELSAQRKSRQILLHIETIYRIVLKLEDLENPTAIATSLIVKEKREKEKQQQLQQQQNNENQSVIELIGGGNDGGVISDRCSTTTDIKESEDDSTTSDNTPNSSLSEKYCFELESKDKLIQKLIPLLGVDKIIGMMNVRKGKTLIRRMLPHISDNPIRWNVWIGVFSSLQTILKKDKDDNDGQLYAFYTEFRKQIATANFDIIIKIANAMPLSDKKLNNLFASKFCISSLVALLLRVEEIYSQSTSSSSSSSVDQELHNKWSQFLSILSISLNKTIQHQTISAAIESDAIQPMVNHFSRFSELKLDSLLALFSEAKQQID